MHKSKRAQISDTMSWIVATIIIVLILSIPIFVVKWGVINPNRVFFNRIQDPIATKSISGYLLQNYNSVIKKEVNNPEVSITNIDASIYPFLLSLRRAEIEGWNVIIYRDDKKVYENDTMNVITHNLFWDDKFNFKESGKEVRIYFWMEGQVYV